MSSKNSETPLKDRIDWVTVIVPFLAILALCVCFILMPDASKSVLDTIRFILGDTFGLFYLAVGLFVFLLSLYLAFSRFGTIRLGKPDEKPKYPLFVWASMMFTSGLAADILFYSFCEWILYANDPHRRARFHADLVQHLPTVPLGSDPVGILSGTRRLLRLYASCERLS